MGLDIRLPIGLMFLTLGPLLFGYGAWADIAMDRTVGCGMTLFGAGAALLALRAKKHQDDA